MLVLQAEVNKYGRLHSAELNEVAAECGRITSFSASLPPTGTTMKTQNCSAYSGGKNSAFSISLESSWQTRNTPLKLSSESMHPVVWAYVCVFFFFWGVSLEGFEWQSLHLMTEHRRPGAQRWSPRLHPQHVVSFFWSWPPRAAAPWWNNRVGRGGWGGKRWHRAALKKISTWPLFYSPPWWNSPSPLVSPSSVVRGRAL